MHPICERHALVTGAAGFIGSHLVDRLLLDGWRVTAIDNFDPFYSETAKHANIASHVRVDQYRLIRADIRDWDALRRQVVGGFDVIVHLAAKAGVRPSVADPITYQTVNVQGTQNLLELARERNVEQFVFASSSSVYGVNPRVPWCEDDPVLMPISPYASTKVSGELLGHVYTHLHGLRFIALRFFTVYGPRQRPDLAIHKFTRMLLAGEPVTVYGDGTSRRDYTYVDDIVDGIRAAMEYSASRFEVINLGNSRTIGLMEMIQAVGEAFGVEPQISYQPEVGGDVPQTWADIRKASQLLGYQPKTEFRDGLQAFVGWIRSGAKVERELDLIPV